MPKFFLFTTLLLLLNCGRETKDKWYGPKIKFKRTENPNYSHYFPGKLDSENKNNQGGNADGTISDEPVPSSPYQPISRQLEDQEKTSGFFAFLFSDSKDENEQKQSMCEEILDINKIVVAGQSKKLKALNIENEKLLDQINNLEKELKQVKRNDLKRLSGLESEINKLNGLIKILSTEIK